MGNTSSKSNDFTIGSLGSDNDEMSAVIFLQEANELKIEKLGNRLTIISVIIPCVICAVLFFAYMDIKEKMVNVHDTGQTEVLGVAEDLDSKLNAMTVDLAGLKHRFETTINSLEAETARLASAKAEKTEVTADLAQMKTNLTTNLTDQTSKAVQKAVLSLETTIKRNMKALEAQDTRISEALTKMVEIEKSFALRTGELESVIQAMNTTIKKEQSRTAALESKVTRQNETMAQVQKELSLVKMKTDTLEQTFIDRKVLNRELDLLNQKIDQKTDIIKSQSQKNEGSIAPLPSPSPRQPKPPESISEKDLLQ
jgi:chromosome segregation ATPase